MFVKIIAIYRSAYAGLTRPAWILFFVQLVNQSGTMVIFFLALYLTRKLGFSTAQAGQVLSFWGAGMLAGAFLGGWLIDRVGAARIQFLSLFLTGIFLIAISFFRDYWPVASLVFIQALFSGALYPASNTSMARVCPSEIHTKGYALSRLASNIGATIGPVVGGFLAIVDYRLLFWVDGATCLAAAVVFRIYYREPPVRDAAKEQARAPAASPWKDRSFLYLLGLVFMNGVVFNQLFSTFSLFQRTVNGFPENRIGWLLIINTIMIIFIEMPLLNAIKARPKTRTIAIGALFLGAGFAMTPLLPGMLYAGLCVAVWTVGEMLSLPLLTALVASLSRPGSEGRYMGLFSFAFSLSFIVGPLAGTAVYQSLGPAMLWFGCGILGLLISFGFLRFGRIRAGA